MTAAEVHAYHKCPPLATTREIAGCRRDRECGQTTSRYPQVLAMALPLWATVELGGTTAAAL